MSQIPKTCKISAINIIFCKFLSHEKSAYIQKFRIFEFSYFLLSFGKNFRLSFLIFFEKKPGKDSWYLEIPFAWNIASLCTCCLTLFFFSIDKMYYNSSFLLFTFIFSLHERRTFFKIRYNAFCIQLNLWFRVILHWKAIFQYKIA